MKYERIIMTTTQLLNQLINNAIPLFYRNYHNTNNPLVTVKGSCGVKEKLFHSQIERFIQSVWRIAVLKTKSVDNKHIISRSLLGQKTKYVVHSKNNTASFPRVIGTKARKNSPFTPYSVLSNDFESFCGEIETIWGNLRKEYFAEDNRMLIEGVNYLGKRYLQFKLITSLVFAIHKTRSDYKNKVVSANIIKGKIVENVWLAFFATTGVVTASNSKLVSFPHFPNHIAKISYSKGDPQDFTYILPIEPYGFIQFSSGGFSVLGSWLLFHEVFQDKYQKLDQGMVEPVFLSSTDPVGDLRVFYLRKNFEYDYAKIDESLEPGKVTYIHNAGVVNRKKWEEVVIKYLNGFVKARGTAVIRL